MPLPDDFAMRARIRTLLDARGKHQDDLARALRLSQGQISERLKDDKPTDIRAEELGAIAVELESSADWLLRGDPLELPARTRPVEESIFLDVVHRLGPDRARCLMAELADDTTYAEHRHVDTPPATTDAPAAATAPVPATATVGRVKADVAVRPPATQAPPGDAPARSKGRRKARQTRDGSAGSGTTNTGAG